MPPKIIRLDEHRVLKKSYTSIHETEAMKFIAANLTIPVPKVYETSFSDDPNKISQIVMEYIPGESLDTAWTNLSHEQKISTCRQLNGYLSQLEKLKGNTRICNASGGPVTVGLRFPRCGGPFETEADFNTFMIEHEHERMPTIFKDYIRAGLADNHEIHFAHGDFSPRNILVNEDGRVTAVLDWDRSGWYPEYWDTNRMLIENPGIRGYFNYFNYILPTRYEKEVLALAYLTRCTGDG